MLHTQLKLPTLSSIHGGKRSQTGRAPRSRLDRNRQANAAWRLQMPALCDAFLLWKEARSKGKENLACMAGTAFHVVGITLNGLISRLSVVQCEDEVANVSLLRIGFLGCSPQQPTTAVSLDCLELYHQIRRRKSSFSVQAMVKVLCTLHNKTYFQTFRDQFSIAFDAYLDILRHVQALVDQALGRDDVDWRMRHSCPPCNYKQENEPPLIPSRLDAMDGNSSLKRLDGAGSTDDRVFPSSYLIPHAEVEKYKDDVRLRPGTNLATEQNTASVGSPATLIESVCTDNWKAANTVSENTVKVFEQTGIFISACRHGIIQTLVEMRRSGELAKYGIATVNKILDTYGADGATGYDIGCSFNKTIAASSIAQKAAELKHTFVVNCFHGHAHNHQCQLRYLPLYLPGFGIEDLETCERVFSASNSVAPVIRHASHFHWLQFIDLHFNQWDADRYSDLSKFLYNNYKQALDIVNTLGPVVEELKASLEITDADFERWNQEESEYLARVSKEQPEDIEQAMYVEALQTLEAAHPAHFTSNGSLQRESHAQTKARAAQFRAAYSKLNLQMNAVADIECRMGIAERWKPSDESYRKANDFLTNRKFIRAVETLEGLVVQRLFELAKANVAGTGYKLRQHISKAITRRSSAICSALAKYNELAPLQSPPREPIEFSEIASYGWLGEFDLLKYSREDILHQPWASKANRTTATKYFKVARAREEITCLNVEVKRLHAWVDFEDAQFRSVIDALQNTNPPLSREVLRQYEQWHRINNAHRIRLTSIYELPGYTGEEWVSVGDERGVDIELSTTTVISPDEDDTLCDEANRLDTCFE
ncbi:hypothetical protein EDD15DRAFT_2390125 [Pisolithus albus]|nr:hypothetical protein EDD15DRAFT_2390125 [Pisolithus albus]